jgi:hypothetical protein
MHPAGLYDDRAPGRRPVTATADTFPSLDLDRRAVVDSLDEALVVAKPVRRGSPWTADRLEVVWRA